jgi:NO-binding membrane sensor protein with MHYT domain
MGEIDHFSYGLITPALAYTLSALGSLLGLTCTVRARSAHTTARRVWYLLLAAWAIGGTGIWVMHFIAMMGFGVSGVEIRYDVPVTTASALLAVTVVALGLFLVGLGRRHPAKIVVGGAFAGIGVASMHYTGMAAMRFDGSILYDERLVAASILIAVVAATVALWFTVTVRKATAIVASALVMGVAVSGMHYTGMAAMQVHLHSTGALPAGSSVFALLLPILLLVILVVVGLVYAVLAAPTAEDRAGAAYLDAQIASRRPAATPAAAAPTGPPTAGFSGFSANGSGPPPEPAAAAGDRRRQGSRQNSRQGFPRQGFPRQGGSRRR